MIAGITVDCFHVKSCLPHFYKATIKESRLNILENNRSFNKQILENN